MEREQTKIEKEVFDHIMELYDGFKEEGDRAVEFNNDRLFVKKQDEIVAYCNSVKFMDGISEEQLKEINNLSKSVANVLIPKN